MVTSMTMGMAVSVRFWFRWAIFRKIYSTPLEMYFSELFNVKKSIHSERFAKIGERAESWRCPLSSRRLSKRHLALRYRSALDAPSINELERPFLERIGLTCGRRAPCLPAAGHLLDARRTDMSCFQADMSITDFRDDLTMRGRARCNRFNIFIFMFYKFIFYKIYPRRLKFS